LHLAFQVPHAAAAPAIALAGWLAVRGLGLATSAASLLPLPWPVVHALLLLPRALAFGLLAAAGVGVSLAPGEFVIECQYSSECAQ
jgi:hypothetical protein